MERLWLRDAQDVDAKGSGWKFWHGCMFLSWLGRENRDPSFQFPSQSSSPNVGPKSHKIGLEKWLCKKNQMLVC